MSSSRSAGMDQGTIIVRSRKDKLNCSPTEVTRMENRYVHNESLQIKHDIANQKRCVIPKGPQTDLHPEHVQQPWSGAQKRNWVSQNPGVNVLTSIVPHTPPTRRGGTSSPSPALGDAPQGQSHGCSAWWGRFPQTARIKRPQLAGGCVASTRRWSRWSDIWAQTRREVLDYKHYWAIREQWSCFCSGKIQFNVKLLIKVAKLNSYSNKS